MNCAAFEKSIALYIENDLRESERRSVEAHLDGCVACRTLSDDLRESQAVFKTLRSGAVNSTALSDLRQRVLNEVGDLEPAPGWAIAMHRVLFAGLRRKTAIASVVLAALVSGGLWYGQSRVVVENPAGVPVVIAKLEVPSAPANVPVSNGPQRAAPVPRSRKHSAISNAVSEELSKPEIFEEPVKLQTQNTLAPMQFLTDDPDIIIYWLPTDKGD